MPRILVKRRALLGLSLGLLAGWRAAPAQAQPLRRVGVLLPGQVQTDVVMPPFRKRLAELGWVEGKTVALEVRHLDNRYERAPALAAELVRLNVDLVVTASTPLSRAAKDAVGATPLVFSWVADPVGAGLVRSLNRPGGNATGFSNIAADIVPKQIELLKAMLPKLDRVAELRDPAFPAMSAHIAEAASRLGVRMVQVEAGSAAQIEGAFAAAARARAQAMLIPPSPLYVQQREAIGRLGRQHGIATASQSQSFIAAGGLISYGSDLVDGFARTAEYVDRILRGAAPGDLPVQQADRFELFVNRQTAAQMRLIIPQEILLRATLVD